MTSLTPPPPNLPNHSSHTMAPGFTPPLTEMSMRFFFGGGGKARPMRKADNHDVNKNATFISPTNIHPLTKVYGMYVVQRYGESLGQ
jgi:hypothetical protein